MNNLKNYPSKWKCGKHKDYKDKCKWNVKLNVCERNFTHSLTLGPPLVKQEANPQRYLISQINLQDVICLKYHRVLN